VSAAAKPHFASVILDVDSTLCGIEGIDWLAARRGPDLAAEVAAATDSAMRGELALEEIYAQRLRLVRPSREDVEALSVAYMATLASGAARAVAAWLASGIRVHLVSGGIRNAILPVAIHLGLSAEVVHAVDVVFDDAGAYCDFDHSSPLATAMGKRDVISALDLPRPDLGVGDGSTDLAMRGAVDAFAAFTGFVSRSRVTQHADFVVTSFDELSRIVSTGA
jgi:phosphoserine phosphatase